jgi:phage antirepressor YoqD-like protein
MDIREGTRINAEGVSKPITTTLVTGKGQIYFMNKFREAAQKGA